MHDIERELRTFLSTNFFLGDTANQLGAGESFMERGIIDSTGVLELIGFIEQRYGFTVEDDELIPANLDSLERLETFIQRKAALDNGQRV
jgi:acyl carrier protein